MSIPALIGCGVPGSTPGRVLLGAVVSTIKLVLNFLLFGLFVFLLLASKSVRVGRLASLGGSRRESLSAILSRRWDTVSFVGVENWNPARMYGAGSTVGGGTEGA
jgi:hypothetical protein